MIECKASLSALLTKKNALGGQLAEFSLIIKKTKIRKDKTVSDKHCSYCKHTRHGANRYDANPYRDKIYPWCGKLDHSEKLFWPRVGPGRGRKSCPQASRTQADARLSAGAVHFGGTQMIFVTHEIVPRNKNWWLPCSPMVLYMNGISAGYCSPD